MMPTETKLMKLLHLFTGALATTAFWSWVFLYILLAPIVAMPFYNFMLFFPDRHAYDVKKQIASMKTLLGAEKQDVFFHSPKGVRLHGWLFQLPGEKPVVLVSHGNAGSIVHRLPLAFNLLASGVSVFLYDYEGYGLSDGHPSLETICQDSISAYDYLSKEKKYAHEKIIGYGESLGTGVTCYLALHRNFSKIVLQAPFVSLPSAAGDHFIWLKLYPQFLFPSPHLDNLAVLSKPHPPVLLLHGMLDSTLSYHYSEDIMKKALASVQLVLLPHADHNDIGIVDKELFLTSLRSFWKSQKRE